VSSVPPSDTPGLIIAGVIGAGAAIVAQVISSVTTGMRDTKRFDWEKQERERDRALQERERFLDLKRELYSNFAYQVGNLLGYAHARNNPGWPGPKSVNLEELRRLQWNIDIIATKELGKSVGESITALLAAVGMAPSGEAPRADVVQAEQDAERQWFETYAMMRADLFVTESRAEATQPPPVVARRHWWQRKRRRKGRN
jgi:hypothetical protein